MPALYEFKHNLVENTALPYITNEAITLPGRSYEAGDNVMTSRKGQLERRPGFPVYTADNFGANNTIRRFFHWQRWNGGYYVMCNVTDSSANTSKVYKQLVGTDAAFVLIFTSAANTDPFTFVVARNQVFFANGTDMKKYDGTTVNEWGITPQPTTAPTFTSLGAGNVPNVINHTYIYAYGVNATGYMSDVSLTSVTSQSVTATANRSFRVTGPRCTDTQCDLIHIFRTEDGGAVWYELSNSSIANPGAGAWTIDDNDLDESLDKTEQAPLPYVNGRPAQIIKGVVEFANRIWGFDDDILFWTGWEEITNSDMEVENWPLLNQRRFGREIIGIAVVGIYLMVLTSNRIFKISGYSLATFAWDSFSDHHGLRNQAALDSDGKIMWWLDVSNSVMATDGDAQPLEISADISPDIDDITHASASLAIHNAGERRWVMLADDGADKIRVYDQQTRIWFPPWSITNPTAIESVETAAGTWELLIGRGAAKPLKMSFSTYQDDGSSYTADVTTNLIPVVRQGNPSEYGVVQYISIERNAVALSNVQYLLDEDPTTGTYVSVAAAAISTNPVTPPGRTAGTNLVEEWYWTKLQTSARRVSVKFSWAAANSNFKLFTFDPAYTVPDRN